MAKRKKSKKTAKRGKRRGPPTREEKLQRDQRTFALDLTFTLIILAVFSTPSFQSCCVLPPCPWTIEYYNLITTIKYQFFDKPYYCGEFGFVMTLPLQLFIVYIIIVMLRRFVTHKKIINLEKDFKRVKTFGRLLKHD